MDQVRSNQNSTENAQPLKGTVAPWGDPARDQHCISSLNVHHRPSKRFQKCWMSQDYVLKTVTQEFKLSWIQRDSWFLMSHYSYIYNLSSRHALKTNDVLSACCPWSVTESPGAHPAQLPRSRYMRQYQKSIRQCARFEEQNMNKKIIQVLD